MRTRPIRALTGLALALGAANLYGQSAVPTSPAPADCPPVAADSCQPKPCPLCSSKSHCDHVKPAPANKCASQQAPKVTVIVPEPKVVFRTSCTTSCPKAHSAAPAASRPAAPAAGVNGGQQSYLVPQMSYTMQPVVSMQAVPTVSYGVVTGPVQPAGAIPYTPVGAAAGVAPIASQYFGSPCLAPNSPSAAFGPVSDVMAVIQLIKLLKEVTGFGADTQSNEAQRTIKQLDEAIKKTERDILRLVDVSTANHNNISAVVEALKADTKIDKETKEKLPKVEKVEPMKR